MDLVSASRLGLWVLDLVSGNGWVLWTVPMWLASLLGDLWVPRSGCKTQTTSTSPQQLEHALAQRWDTESAKHGALA